jgi:hypothetical protein
MAEVLTKLYDGKMQKRVLRKETVTVRDPVLIILAGGIRTRVTGLLTHEHVSSGFIPRFVFVTAESDTDRLQPLGPPTTRVQGNRLELIEEMEDLYEHYSGAPAGRPKDALWEAQLSPEAWQRYNQLERTLVESGLDSEQPDLMTPLYDRLAKSTLKAAVLVAAARQRTGTVLVEPADIEIVNGIGKSVWERDLDRIARAIAKRPGVSRSQLMQSYHLNAKQADLVFETLIQRNRITATRNGGRQIYFPMERVGGNKK